MAQTVMSFEEAQSRPRFSGIRGRRSTEPSKCPVGRLELGIPRSSVLMSSDQVACLLALLDE